MIGKDGYYHLREILGYSDCTYFMVLSDRGRGKTWDAHRYFMALKDEQIMCLTRQVPDMLYQLQDFIEPYVRGDAEHEPMDPARFKLTGSKEKGFTLELDEQPKFLFRTLSMVNAIKQESFDDNLTWVWLDEFIPLKYTKIPGVVSEGDALRTIMKTIDHDTAHPRKDRGLKPLRCLMYANPFNWNNPILSYFKVVPKVGIHRVGPGVVCELLPPYEEEKRDRKMTVDEFLGDEVNKNQGWNDQMAFVMPLGKNAEPFMSLRISDKFFTLYKRESVTWVIEKRAHTDVQLHYGKRPTMARYGTVDGLREDEKCINGSRWIETMKAWAYSGKLRYDTINTKFDFLNALSEVK